MILSCDPGMGGGFCLMELSPKVFSSGEIKFFQFPLIGKEPNIAKLSHLIKECSLPPSKITGVIEKVSAMPGQGVSSMFKFGRVYGIAQAFYGLNSISLIEVTPQSWQKQMFDGIPVQYKSGKTKSGNPKRDTKKMSLYAASKLFPSVDITKDWQSDSLLLAEYVRRKMVGELFQAQHQA